MTSKEYVYELTLDEALQKLDMTLYDRNCDIRVIKARQQLIDVIRNETNKLKKDLEVLEILKKSIKETGISKGDGTIILKWQLFDIKEQKSFNLFNITIKSEEDFNKAKEWLEKSDN